MRIVADRFGPEADDLKRHTEKIRDAFKSSPPDGLLTISARIFGRLGHAEVEKLIDQYYLHTHGFELSQAVYREIGRAHEGDSNYSRHFLNHVARQIVLIRWPELRMSDLCRQAIYR